MTPVSVPSWQMPEAFNKSHLSETGARPSLSKCFQNVRLWSIRINCVITVIAKSTCPLAFRFALSLAGGTAALLLRSGCINMHSMTCEGSSHCTVTLEEQNGLGAGGGGANKGKPRQGRPHGSCNNPLPFRWLEISVQRDSCVLC